MDSPPSDQAAVYVPPATLVSSTLHRLPAQLLVAELFFDVPLDYRNAAGATLRLFARAAFRYEKPIVGTPLGLGEASPGGTSPGGGSDYNGNGGGGGGRGSSSTQDIRELFTKPWMAYLEGGPGAGNREPQDYPFVRQLLQRGYQVLFLDYRGTGMSSAISAATLRQRGGASAEAQAAYLRLFRADNIVRDLEAVRQYLTAAQPAAKRAWSILGQSFGGFVSLTYLSHHAQGLREVFMTGGMAPVGKTPDEVYRATYAKAVQRNRAFFAKYPEDAGALRAIGAYLNAQPGGGVALPAGGRLTLHRVLTFGYMFGFHGGLDSAHALLLRMQADIAGAGLLTRATLVAVEQYFPLDVLPLYGLLHEAIYCSGRGVSSRWAAQRVGAAEVAGFGWLGSGVVDVGGEEDAARFGKDILLSGEMIYPFMFDTFPELMEMKAAAQLLADYDAWEALYDEAALAANRVPVYAATYMDDLYVDYGLAKQTAAKVGGVRMYETNSLYHNAIRARADEVMAQLFRLRDDSLD